LDCERKISEIRRPREARKVYRKGQSRRDAAIARY
jgi:hypothetical protein